MTEHSRVRPGEPDRAAGTAPAGPHVATPTVGPEATGTPQVGLHLTATPPAGSRATATLPTGPDAKTAMRTTRPVGLVSPGDTISRLAGLGIICLNLVSGSPGVSAHGRGLVVALLGGFCAALWLVWTFARWILPEGWRPRAIVVLPLAFGLVGSVLAGTVPTTAGAVFPACAALSLAVRTKLAFSLSMAFVFSAIVLVSGAVTGHPATEALAWSALIFGLYGIGQARRSRAKQLESAEQLLAETERANAETAHSAALAERGRIAREIHDVLAHSLAALTVQLEAADALLADGRTERAHDYVVKARRIAREGLVETRRAITALREDLPPLPALLDSLAANYREDLGVDATVTVVGEPRPLSAEASLTVYRTAQESLTNIRKHAPGAEVELTLAFDPERTRLTVVNGPARDGASALAGSGGGYGLAGLRERAELAAGTLTAQAVSTAAEAEGWAVTLTIPVAGPAANGQP